MCQCLTSTEGSVRRLTASIPGQPRPRYREKLRALAEASMPTSSITLQYYSLLRFFLWKLATTSSSLQLCAEIMYDIVIVGKPAPER